MPPQPETPSLRQVQSAFAASLRATARSDSDTANDTLLTEIVGPPAISASARLAIYSNNARYFFQTALERTYRVLHRRVGDEYFRQLTREYRQAHPSTHGDLHWIGQSFPQWLTHRTRDTGYAWLSELARLEWACESSWAAADAPSVALSALGQFPPEQLGSILPGLHPSVRCITSPYPVWSVWQANQGDEPGPPVDLALGAEHCVVACTEERVAVYRVAVDDFQLIEQLAQGTPLGEAVAALDYDLAGLPQLLAWLFNERLVVSLRLR